MLGLRAGGDQPEETADSCGDGATTGVNTLPTTEKPLDDVWGLFLFPFLYRFNYVKP